jgi:hypothetical protein
MSEIRKILSIEVAIVDNEGSIGGTERVKAEPKEEEIVLNKNEVAD